MKYVARQYLGLFVFLGLACSSAYGDDWGDATLTVCNKGSVAINVVVAVEPSVFLGAFLDVSGWTNIPPGHCKPVYKEAGTQDNGAEHAYIGFGFDSDFIPGRIEQVPDFGQFRFGTRVLTKSDKRLCVRNEPMSYRIRNDSLVDCASFHSDRNDPGGYVPFASALYFIPKASHCYTEGFNGQVVCGGGEYYLNVKPTASDRELHASAGSESGKDAPSFGPSLGDQLMNELGKAAAEQRKRREEMQAEEAVQEEARAGARARQNVCISDDLTTEWRNPSAGGKMETLKRLLNQSLRERANTPGYDQTRWIAVDSRYYSAWNPGTSFAKLVSTIPGGSCGAVGHREILALAP